jgi:hypothetical protein
MGHLQPVPDKAEDNTKMDQMQTWVVMGYVLVALILLNAVVYHGHMLADFWANGGRSAPQAKQSVRSRSGSGGCGRLVKSKS